MELTPYLRSRRCSPPRVLLKRLSVSRELWVFVEHECFFLLPQGACRVYESRRARRGPVRVRRSSLSWSIVISTI
ncbi:UNVERIFIED_CONTAM: hypothetical protein FKN15_074661 [Acipenser sinensis]